jgi:hypothetical protein
MIRQLWARLTSPNHLNVEVDFGGVTFTAEGHETYVITAFLQFLNQLKDAEQETAQESHFQQLPHFRTKPVGRC